MTPAIDSTRSVTPNGAAGWLGHAPSGWTPRRLGHLLLRNDGGVWGEDGDVTDTIVLRSTEVSVGGAWDITNPARRRLTVAETASGILAKGDLVVVKSSGSELHLGKTALVGSEVASHGCAFSNFMQRLRLSSNAEPRYAFYLLNSSLGREQLNYFGSTTTGLRNLNGSVFSKLVWPGAPIEEQCAVADFLDRETEKIDALVAKKQRLIELLQEKRTALISHAVTRGLDPDTPLKNSSIAGIGRIPETWKPTRLWAVLSAPVTDGPHETPDFVDEGMPFLSVDAIQEGELVFTGCRFVSLADHTEFRRKAAPQRDDILMGKAASTGKIARVKTDVEFSIWSPLALIRLNHSLARSRYVEYALKAPLAQLQIDLLCTSNTQKNISMSDIPRVVIMLPPLREQDEIADRLDEETQAIDRLIGRVRLALERLGEHRSALITAAVTGQIDVGARKARRQAERP